MILKPILDQILIERDKPAQESEGGLALPAEALEKKMTGTVIAVGEGREDSCKSFSIPFAVKVGDRVMFKKFAGTELEVGGVEYVMIFEADIFGVLGDG